MLFGFFFFFFNDTATTEIYTLSLHDALPICSVYDSAEQGLKPPMVQAEAAADADGSGDAGRRLQAHTRLQSFFDISPRYKSVRGHLRKAADHTGVDYDLLKAVIAVESGLDRKSVV